MGGRILLRLTVPDSVVVHNGVLYHPHGSVTPLINERLVFVTRTCQEAIPEALVTRWESHLPSWFQEFSGPTHSVANKTIDRGTCVIDRHPKLRRLRWENAPTLGPAAENYLVCASKIRLRTEFLVIRLRMLQLATFINIFPTWLQLIICIE